MTVFRPGRRSGRRRYRPGRLLSRGSRLSMWAGLLIGIGVYVLFGIVPAAGNVIISFTDYTGLPGAPVHNVGFSNYSSMGTTQSAGFTPAVVATVVFVLAVTIAQNALALLLAHRLSGQGRMAAAGRVLVFLPIALGVTIVGLIWILVFDPQQGPAASLFGAVGVHSAFFGASGWAMPLVIFVQVWQNAGFSTLVFIGGLRAIDPQIYEAAGIDGIRPWQRLRRITFPLLAPAVTANVLLAVVGAFTTYNLIYVLTDGQYGTQTLGMLAFNAAFGSFQANLGYGAAVTVVLFVLTLIVALPLMALLRYRERRLLGTS
ncbi:MAG: sugar ABC transporter permease [Streptosporangiaceae bacterium]|nr:sugar ABC transporter permease [Streptosporangiaceae bacterium]MBV9855370.1 sugar ABC transporter permease [Streptosporangiaceae bacterium]